MNKQAGFHPTLITSGGQFEMFLDSEFETPALMCMCRISITSFHSFLKI